MLVIVSALAGCSNELPDSGATPNSGGSGGAGGASAVGGTATSSGGAGGTTSGGSATGGSGGSAGGGGAIGGGASGGSGGIGMGGSTAGAGAGGGGIAGNGGIGAGGSGGASGAGGSSGSAGAAGGFNEGTELKAFPTAEGYGRLAKGGRGGRVLEVTNLNDSGPGSLRDAVLATGPRTVVFRVSGVINLQSKLIIRGENRFLTIAAQTAPGKGVVVHGYSFGMIGGEETILRFIRTRVGTSSGVTMDGMGISSSLGPVIYDHVSVSWTIDEGFSSRGTVPSNFTLQRSMISECLNDAGHEIQMSLHGYAASISGDIGSFHHNLLAHCAGRNWSLAGGLGKEPVEFWGRLDIRNNVVYNWDNRTTDGGAHQVNFVGNYYKPGPASTLFVALSADIENFPGTQSYFFSGNVMPGRFDESNQTAGRRVRYINRTEASVTWPVFVNSEFFPSYVNTQSATAAYESVIGNVGANKPRLDDHDARIIRETRDGTFTYRGSKTDKPGLPDNEADVGGLESYPQESRPATWDTDHDGIPEDWERAHGLDPSNAADGNATNLSRIGYTNLEMYLNELAGDFR